MTKHKKVSQSAFDFLRRPGGQSQFSTHLAAQISDDSRIQKVQKYIIDHIDTDLSLPVLAGKVGIYEQT